MIKGPDDQGNSPSRFTIFQRINKIRSQKDTLKVCPIIYDGAKVVSWLNIKENVSSESPSN